MRKSAKSALEELKAAANVYSLPLALGAVLMNIVLSAYMDGGVFMLTAAFVLFETLLMVFFDWLKPKKILRGVIYIAVTLAVMVIGGLLLYNGAYFNGIGFIEWFYLRGDDVQIGWYLAFIFFFAGYFLTSVLYYFTVYRYRCFAAMLVVLIPFVIYGKRDDSISTVKIVIMLTVFLGLMVHQRLIIDEKKKIVFNPPYFAAVALFITAAAAATMFMIVPPGESRLEKDSNIFDFTFQGGGSGYDDIGMISSPRFGSAPTGRILFYVDSSDDENVIYLRRQSYDIFLGDYWELRSDFYEYDLSELSGDNEINSPIAVYDLMKKLAETGKYESYGLTEDMFKEPAYSNTANLAYEGVGLDPTYIPSPLMLDADGISDAYRDVHGEVFYYNGSTRRGTWEESADYTIEGAAERNYAASLPFDQNSFFALLTAAYYDGNITYDQLYNIQRLYSNYTIATNCSAEMLELANEIVAGIDGDYAKALALADYFENNGYVYDLDYRPPNESIDYFLFTGKTGSCTSYATAMTLLARLAGLPARYVEGFAAYEKGEDGRFIIRDAHAHAFVEVYISGAGWVTFDPTVSGYMRDYSTVARGGNSIVRTLIEYLSKLFLFLGVLFVLIFIVFIDYVVEALFRLSLKFRKTPSAKISAVYRRIIKLLEHSSRERLAGMAPHEICEYVRSRRNCDIDEVISLFEKTCFGAYTPSKAEFESAYSCYKKSWRALVGRKMRKKR